MDSVTALMTSCNTEGSCYEQDDATRAPPIAVVGARFFADVSGFCSLCPPPPPLSTLMASRTLMASCSLMVDDVTHQRRPAPAQASSLLS
jgi:hypothetical protein